MFITRTRRNQKKFALHPQIPSLVLSTGMIGFNCYKPDNVVKCMTVKVKQRLEI
eukprot:TRINITY_DN10694_c0_g1_i1.p1 TRINITY_DN10694_c0_g1~~TRINITY_DN10694_c0_g1_i1.p1  ORF type:complete len:54 (+),score=6.95 TRINITY_DN10694_c0_g1_i1:424-585(+)